MSPRETGTGIAHSLALVFPQPRLVIERLGPQPESSKHSHDLREQINSKRVNDAERIKELERLQKENERLR